MESGDRLRVGLAGLGRFGKLHAAVLGAMPGVLLSAICDPQADELAAMRERYPQAEEFTDFTSMLDRASLDALFIVTPEQYHPDHLRAALERGIPTFIEKPLSLTAADGQRLAEMATSAGAPLQVGFLLRFDVQHQHVKSDIERGALGEVVSLRAKRNTSKSWFVAYGDRAHTMYETAIHDVDLLLWYAGSPVVKVHALERNVTGMRYPDGCWALVEFASGAVGMIETSWFVPAGAPANVVTPSWHGTIDAELEIIGTAGTSRIRLLDGPLSHWSAKFTAVPETGLWPAGSGGIAGALREEDAHFIHRVRTGAPESIASVADAVAGLRVIEAIVASAQRGSPVELISPS